MSEKVRVNVKVREGKSNLTHAFSQASHKSLGSGAPLSLLFCHTDGSRAIQREEITFIISEPHLIRKSSLLQGGL
jgi:hypothetical protein